MSNPSSLYQDPTPSWRDELLARADAITRLLTCAADPEDAVAAACDIAAAIAHTDAVRRRDVAAAFPPAPTSRLFRGFAEALREKLVAVVEILDARERQQLSLIGPGFFEELAAGEPDVLEAIVDLAPHPPEVIALWLQLHLKALEARFAS